MNKAQRLGVRRIPGWCALGLVVLTLGAKPHAQEDYEPAKMPAREVLALVQGPDPSRRPLLVDVRSEAEYERGHAAGAVSVPLRKISDDREVVRKLIEAGVGRPLVVYCTCPNDGLARTAARGLAAAGGVPVVMLGGLTAWRIAGGDVEYGGGGGGTHSSHLAAVGLGRGDQGRIGPKGRIVLIRKRVVGVWRCRGPRGQGDALFAGHAASRGGTLCQELVR